MEDRKISIEMLLAKIGQLVVQLEIANSDIARLENEINALKQTKENHKESTSDK